MLAETSAGSVDTAGASGATVSTVKVVAFESLGPLPLMSLALTYTVCGPSASGVIGV